MKEKEKPSVLAELYGDNSPESQQARELLRKSGVSFNDWVSPRDFIPEPGFVPPSLNAWEGQFNGLEGVKIYVDLITSTSIKTSIV